MNLLKPSSVPKLVKKKIKKTGSPEKLCFFGVLKYTLLVTLLFLSLILTPASAQETILVTDSTVDIRFPHALIFNIQAESTTNITKLRLHYQVDRMNYAEVISEAWAKFTPSPKVTTKWVWDTRKAPLPPGVNIKYWWTIEDAAGKSVKTPVKTVQFTDHRYKWQKLDTEQISLLWYEGSHSFAQDLLTTSQQALNRLAKDVGINPQRHIWIYIYASTQDLQGAMVFPREWTGGAAYPEYGIIILGISPRQIDWGKKALAHELAHLIVHQATFSPYGDILPTWLDEGLAMYAEGEPDPSLQSWLKKAIAEQKLITLQSLSSPFSAKTEQAFISYAQSDSVVRFLIQTYGRDKMFQLLDLLKQGNTYDEALTKTYGFTMEELDTKWRTYITGKTKLPSGSLSLSWLRQVFLPLILEPVP